jgi:hypothetical protein
MDDVMPVMASPGRNRMDEILTLEEMKKRYSGEWVLIGCTELDPEMRIIRGRILAHSLDRDEVYRQIPLSLLVDDQIVALAVEYMGEVPEDVAVVL